MCGDHAILHAKDLKNHNVVKLELQTTIEESRLQVKQFKKNLISEMVNETQKIIIALKEASSKAVSDFKKNNKNVDQVKPFQFDKKRISFIIDQVKMIGEVYKINKDFQRPKVKTSVHPNLILIEELRKSIDELQAKIIKLEDEKKILTQQHQLEMKQETDRANELESKLKELKGKFNNKGNQFRKNPKALKGEIKSIKNQLLQSEKKIEELQVIVNRNSLIPSASQLIINSF
jgi:DNA repair exonuclease SbcCD ATPase subunit